METYFRYMIALVFVLLTQNFAAALEGSHSRHDDMYLTIGGSFKRMLRKDASGARTMASQTNKKTKGLLFHAERLLQRHSSVAVETSPSKARKHLQATLHQSVPASYEGVLPFTDIPFLKENKVSIPLSERLLQDYAPTANERTPSHYRKLLQDYSPMANRRSPSINRKLLQELPTKRKDITPSSQDRLLQDYSPTANSRSPSINR